ncbi:maleylpyruvate isomerase family mycothiol-dependent enzyme [Actinoplanes bogorensis]|uniref:Maleylpyruvate isomerase family mycothiol-dependent enzyme n=1 Tax=Paractinoplanes bogorensis TaxID=1610840 RepID=A0ABS5YPV5_9ACTN|nr:maleylpyruvate isomerase family mycothiol-dependent enzyme [Actinoplanes bogorensis]MBU2665484.1 maleylpyruvate isomerase family mycothiol-dependent enzyme [Actinoplanes bogorensis]
MSLDFDELLRLIDERSAAFRAVVASAPDLDVRVPSCPEWTLFDLVQHLGEGRRKWAAIVAAGPADAPAPKPVWASPAPRESLDGWMAASTGLMLDALRTAGPDGGCWTWWPGTATPETAAGVARHQLQEFAVHTYDAQLAVGSAEPLPEVVALDGVEEFLHTCGTTEVPWPYEPVVLAYQTTEGPSWSVRLDGDGAHVSHPATSADAVITASASELVMLFYGRITLDAVKLDGDRRHYERLIDWDPTA